jgi:hypothetical protein
LSHDLINKKSIYLLIFINSLSHFNTFLKVSQAGSAVCTVCSAGTYADHDTNKCVPCPANTHAKAQSDVCTPCPLNTYSLLGDEKCRKCDKGYKVNTARTGCQAPTPSTRPPTTPTTTPPAVTSPTPEPTHGDCAASYYIFMVDGVIQGCKKCPPGTFSGFISYYCSTCPAGSMVNSEQTGCVPNSIPIPPSTKPPAVTPPMTSPTPPPTYPPTITPSFAPSPPYRPSGKTPLS